MKKKTTIFHLVLLSVEAGSLVGLGLWFGVWPLNLPVVHSYIGLATFGLSLGVGLLVASILIAKICSVNNDLYQSRMAYRLGLIMAILMLVMGCCFVSVSFPEWMLPRVVSNSTERWHNMDAVKIVMDADGGSCNDECRIVKASHMYGETLNIYPIEDYRLMRLMGAKVDLRDQSIVVDLLNGSMENAFANYWVSNAVPTCALGGKWTYVVEMVERIGEFTGWYVGQTAETNSGVYTQLACGFVKPTIQAGKKQFIVLDSTKWGEKCNMLDRAYIHLKPRQHLRAKFRVSLFAGTGVNESNYHYVKPGETIACKLPVPTREGYVFEGWYDGDKRVTGETKVEKRETHTLKAHWRKL